MNIAEKEYKKKKNLSKSKETKRPISSKPDWFNKDIKEDMATLEEIEKLESRMKRS